MSSRERKELCVKGRKHDGPGQRAEARPKAAGLKRSASGASEVRLAGWSGMRRDTRETVAVMRIFALCQGWRPGEA